MDGTIMISVLFCLLLIIIFFCYIFKVNEKYIKLKIATDNDIFHKDAALEKATTDFNRINADMAYYREELIKSQAENKNLKEKLDTQSIEISELHKMNISNFENLSNKILKENTNQFKELSSQTLSDILSPIKEKMSNLENKVQETYEKHLKDNTSLKEQISTLADMSKQIGQDAVNLTNALKGDKKIQGNWGEFVLESLLEKSGLEKDIQYKIQVSLTNDNGETRRPDAVIYLPDNKNLVIDSKVSLVAYNDYCKCDSLEQKSKFQEHVTALKNHIKQLSEKKYEQLHNINAPDYVLMFIPIEPAFNLAMQDDTLFTYALDRNIVLVTASTLLATLRTVASIWKQESQKKHVLEIAAESGKLYDKFVGFLEDMQSVSDSMDKSKKSFDAAMNKLTEGSGNIVSRFEKMKKLGAKASKSIDPKLLNDIE